MFIYRIAILLIFSNMRVIHSGLNGRLSTSTILNFQRWTFTLDLDLCSDIYVRITLKISIFILSFFTTCIEIRCSTEYRSESQQKIHHFSISAVYCLFISSYIKKMKLFAVMKYSFISHLSDLCNLWKFDNIKKTSSPYHKKRSVK